MLTRCAAAVGQCGYNTAIDWLQAGVPGVFVPFAEAGEVEQTLRAASLQERYGFGQIAEDELTPENLAAAADGRRPARALHGKRVEIRRRGAHQPHPRRLPGRPRMKQQLLLSIAELKRWRDEGLTLPIWWRDDDAIAPTPALERLLALAEQFEAPLHLAVIPEPATAELADRLRTVPQHLRADAWLAARNHAPPDQKKAEFGVASSRPAMLDEIAEGWRRMEEMFGSQAPARLHAALESHAPRSRGRPARNGPQGGLDIHSSAAPNLLRATCCRSIRISIR